jgi:hypothetical protein
MNKHEKTVTLYQTALPALGGELLTIATALPA